MHDCSYIPQYILVNLGMSENFGTIDFEHLTFPAVMSVDYIRVYQPSDSKNVGCSPKDFPTASYINQCDSMFTIFVGVDTNSVHRYIEAYTNPNLTTWVDDYKQTIPKNNLIDQC